MNDAAEELRRIAETLLDLPVANAARRELVHELVVRIRAVATKL